MESLKRVYYWNDWEAFEAMQFCKLWDGEISIVKMKENKYWKVEI